MIGRDERHAYYAAADKEEAEIQSYQHIHAIKIMMRLPRPLYDVLRNVVPPLYGEQAEYRIYGDHRRTEMLRRQSAEHAAVDKAKDKDYHEESCQHRA